MNKLICLSVLVVTCATQANNKPEYARNVIYIDNQTPDPIEVKLDGKARRMYEGKVIEEVQVSASKKIDHNYRAHLNADDFNTYTKNRGYAPLKEFFSYLGDVDIEVTLIRVGNQLFLVGETGSDLFKISKKHGHYELTY